MPLPLIFILRLISCKESLLKSQLKIERFMSLQCTVRGCRLEALPPG